MATTLLDCKPDKKKATGRGTQRKHTATADINVNLGKRIYHRGVDRMECTFAVLVDQPAHLCGISFAISDLWARLTKVAVDSYSHRLTSLTAQ